MNHDYTLSHPLQNRSLEVCAHQTHFTAYSVYFNHVQRFSSESSTISIASPSSSLLAKHAVDYGSLSTTMIDLQLT